MQRLPLDIVRRADNRIAMVLQRAIEGEMGKEGKKGAISDGLKVPAFFVLLFLSLTTQS